MFSKRIGCFTVAVLALFMAACGGGGGSNGGGGGRPQPPTISPSSATIVLGGSKNFSVTGASNCSLSGPGTLNYSGSTATVSIGTSAPSSWQATLTCTNSAGSASAAITYERPVPQVIDVLPRAYCPAECVVGLVIQGSGFYDGGTVQIDSNPAVVIPSGSTFNEIDNVVVVFDTNRWDPRFHDVRVSTPSDGHGGGTSAPGHFAMLGNLDTGAASSTAIFSYDPAEAYTDPSGATRYGLVHKFNRTTLAEELSFGIGEVAQGIAFDETTNSLVVVNSGGNILLYNPDTGQRKLATNNPEDFSAKGVSAKDGYACVARDSGGVVASVDLQSEPYPRFVNQSIGDIPWNTAMDTLPGDGRVCSVFNVGDLVFSVVKIPEMTTLRFSVVNSLRSIRDVQLSGAGWQTGVFTSGPAAHQAVILSRNEKALIFMDETTGTEVRRVTLDGDPFRIAIDNANGNVIVAMVDSSAGLTRFKRVRASDGTVTNLSSTSNLLATYFFLSADGQKLIVTNGRNQPQSLDNN